MAGAAVAGATAVRLLAAVPFIAESSFLGSISLALAFLMFVAVYLAAFWFTVTQRYFGIRRPRRNLVIGISLLVAGIMLSPMIYTVLASVPGEPPTQTSLRLLGVAPFLMAPLSYVLGWLILKDKQK